MPQETSTSYRWGEGQTIRRIDVRTDKRGHAVAYLYADNSPEQHQQRQDIRSAIRLKGWGTLSDNRDGAFALRVSGMRSSTELVDMLREYGFVNSEAQVSSKPIEQPKSKDLGSFIKSNSLQISGSIATVGNLMAIASGFHRGKGIGQIGQGAAFAVADLPLAMARRDDGRQLSNLLRGLKQHYEKNGIVIPGNASIHIETSDSNKSLGELSMDYIHRYANQIKCSLEVVAAGFTIKAGHEQNSAAKKYVPWLWGSGFLASLLIPEKKIDEEKYAQAGGLERFWMNVQANPLMVGGLLGYTNNVASYASAYNERKVSLAPGGDGKRFYRWDVAIPTVMLGANGTYAISKKTVGGDIKASEVEQDVYTVACQILNKQPEELREKAMEATAQFLGERTEIRGSKRDVMERLREEMARQRQNPWFEQLGLPRYTAVPRRAARDASGSEAAPGIPTATVQREGLEVTSPAPHAALTAAR